MNGILNAKEANLGQDHTAEPDTTATQGTGQTAEGTAAGVAEAIQVTKKHLDTTTDAHPGTPTDYAVEATDAVQPFTTTPGQPQHTKH